jgi:hypothetical protein
MMARTTNTATIKKEKIGSSPSAQVAPQHGGMETSNSSSSTLA